MGFDERVSLRYGRPMQFSNRQPGGHGQPRFPPPPPGPAPDAEEAGVALPRAWWAVEHRQGEFHESACYFTFGAIELSVRRGNRTVLVPSCAQ